jgi:hypothetical protein
MSHEAPDQERLTWGQRADEVPGSRDKLARFEEDEISPPSPTSESTELTPEQLRQEQEYQERKDRPSVWRDGEFPSPIIDS